MTEVNEFLNKSWNYLRCLWGEFSLSKDNILDDRKEQKNTNIR